MFIADRAGIISSILYGLTAHANQAQARNVMFTVYAPAVGRGDCKTPSEILCALIVARAQVEQQSVWERLDRS
jgi:hypothetical protein